MVNKMLTAKYLKMEGFLVNFNFFLDNENIVTYIFHHRRKNTERMIETTPPKTRKH